MNRTDTRPIDTNWTIQDPNLLPATAAEINALLGQLTVTDITPALIPYMAAASAELSLITGQPPRAGGDDAAATLLRSLAMAALAAPEAGGIHTDRLRTRLQR